MTNESELHEFWKGRPVGDLLADGSVPAAGKLAILKRLRTDHMALARASDEGMEGGEDTRLREIEMAIDELESGTGPV